MKSILIFIGVCFSAVAMASDWHLVYFDKDYNTMFYDRESVVKTKTNTTKAWIARVSYRDISIYNLTLAFMEVDKQK